jgi:hypothetical protein
MRCVASEQGSKSFRAIGKHYVHRSDEAFTRETSLQSAPRPTSELSPVYESNATVPQNSYRRPSFVPLR